MTRRPLVLLAMLALAGCGVANDGTEQAGAEISASTAPQQPAPAAPPVPLRAEDFPQLASRNCVAVAQFTLEAIGAREFARAALAWNSSTPIDAAALQAAFGDYTTPEFTWTEPVVEGGAGSLYCTIAATLKDADDAKKPPLEGNFMLRRVNDVDGATPEQLRWTFRSSTFLEDPETSPAT